MPAEAEVDHPGAAVDRPADRLGLCLEADRPVGSDDLGDQKLGREADAGDTLAVVERGADLTRDERSVPDRVLVPSPLDEALRLDDAPGELRMARVDARVDDRDADGGQCRSKVPELKACTASRYH